MSRFEEQLKDKKMEKEHAFQMNKMRREKQAGLYFDLAKIFCAGMVVGNLSSLFSYGEIANFNYVAIVGGIILTVVFIALGQKILSK